MKKTLIIIAIGLVLAIVAVGGYLWHLMGKPLYEPGMVRAETSLHASLEPPEQLGDGAWRVEEDVRLHHFSHGSGRAVLIVHGGPGEPILRPLAALRPLEADFELHYYHQRGCGKSTRPIDRFSSSSFIKNVPELDGALGLAAQIADIERIRRILGEEKLILIGHSFGGFLAAMYAAEFPEYIDRMVLVAPADLLVLPAEGGGLFEEIERKLPESRRDEYSAFLEEYLSFGDLFSKSEEELAATNARLGDYYFDAIGRASLPPAVADERGETGGWMVQAAYMSMGMRHDYRDALGAVTAPVLVLHGTADLQPDRSSRTYADLLPDGRFLAVESAGHFLLSEDSPAATEAIAGFLASGD